VKKEVHTYAREKTRRPTPICMEGYKTLFDERESCFARIKNKNKRIYQQRRENEEVNGVRWSLGEDAAIADPGDTARFSSLSELRES